MCIKAITDLPKNVGNATSQLRDTFTVPPSTGNPSGSFGKGQIGFNTPARSPRPGRLASQTSAKVQQLASERRRKVGQGSTLLTSTKGLIDSPKLFKKTLLGR